MNSIVVDLDHTLTLGDSDDYSSVSPNTALVKRLQEYREKGFRIVIHTSRNMRTYEGNIGKINVHTLPGIIKWLEEYNVPYDEIFVGKPWCGVDGFYIDDRAIRPDEFVNLSNEEISKLIGD